MTSALTSSNTETISPQSRLYSVGLNPIAHRLSFLSPIPTPNGNGKFRSCNPISISLPLPAVSWHGKTHEEALAMAQEVLAMMIETYQEQGKPLPQPQVLCPQAA
jgi:hypothetical protein